MKHSVELQEVLRSAAQLQQVVPDAVLVGGSAAAFHAGHRMSFDHDHVLPDLARRYQAVLEAVAATDGWATSVRASSPPMTLLGSLGGIEAGLRQLRRSVPLEIMTVTLDSGQQLRVPTAPETLRVKAYLVVMRNQVRDYLDVAALADHLGIATAATILNDIDRYYTDGRDDPQPVLSALIEKLAEPAPKDTNVITQLATYKGLDSRWHDWKAVSTVCRELADAVLDSADRSAQSPPSDPSAKD